MIPILIAIIVILFIIIIYVSVVSYKDKKAFEERIDVLEDIITQITQKQTIQTNQLELSDVLFMQLKESNSHLSQAIYDMNTDLFNDLFSKKTI
jgi:septation ring formation regulator EzrA